MSGASRDLFEPTDRQMIRISESLNSRYESLSTNPKYWLHETRVSRMAKAIEKESSQIPGLARNFYERSVPDIYLLGGQSVVPGFDLDVDDEKLLAAMADRGMNSIQISQELSRRNLNSWVGAAQTIDDPLKELQKSLAPTPLKGMITSDGRSWRPESYSRLVMAADASSSFNLGVISAAEREGLGYVRVVDGAGCGWTDHRDADTAHGKIVKLSEARAYPIAHPYCQRTFVVDEETRGRKRSGRARKAVRVATALGGATAVAGTVGFVSLKYSPTLQRKLTMFLEGANPQFKEWRRQMLLEGRTEQDMIMLGDSWFDDPATAAAQIPEWLVDHSALSDRKVVGDAFSSFTESAMRFRSASPEGFVVGQAEAAFTQNSIRIVEAKIPGLGANFNYNIPDIIRGRKLFGLEKHVGPLDGYLNVSDRVTGTLSRAVGQKIRFGALVNRAGYITRYGQVRVGGLVKYRISHIQKGLANRLILNPNGMVRAGFVLDPQTGFVTPSLRFIPKGPIRVSTTLARSRGRHFNGVPIEDELRKVLRPKAREATDTLDEVQIDYYKRAVESGTIYEQGGWTLQKPLLTVGDFLPGTVEEIIYDTFDDVIRRGRIPNALEYRDGTGRRQVRDLFIKDGVFVTRVDIDKGLVTAANTELRVLLPGSARVNIRTSVDLTNFDITSFSDLKHIRISDVIDFTKDIREKARITGMSAELTAFGYTPFEITKVLGYRWEDGVLFSQEVRSEAIRRVKDLAIQQEFFYRMLYDAKSPISKYVIDQMPSELMSLAKRISSDLGDQKNESLYAFALIVDSRRHIYRAIAKELDESVVQVINKALRALDGQYSYMRREIRQFISSTKDIATSVAREMNLEDASRRIAQVRQAVRDDVSAFLELDRADVVKLSDYTDPDGIMGAAIPSLPRGEVVAHELARIVSMTTQEIKDVLGTTLARARDIWDSAYDGLSTIIYQRFPSMQRYLDDAIKAVKVEGADEGLMEAIRGFRKSEPGGRSPTRRPLTTQDVTKGLGEETSGHAREFESFYDKHVSIQNPERFPIDPRFEEEFRSILPWLEKRFPSMSESTVIRVANPDTMENSLSVFAFVRDRDPTIYINARFLADWDKTAKIVRRNAGAHFAEGATDMNYILSHEFGHVLHLHDEKINTKLDSKFMRALINMKDSGGVDSLFDGVMAVDIPGGGRVGVSILDALDAVDNGLNEFAVLPNGGSVSSLSIQQDFMSNHKNLEVIRSMVSEYATTNWYELIAETFAQGMFAEYQYRLPTVLFEVLDDILEGYLGP